MDCGRSARRALAVSVLALAWAPSALADDSLPAPLSVSADVADAVSLPSVAAPSEPLPVVSAPPVPLPVATEAAGGVTRVVEQAPSALPKSADPVVSTVAETVTAATAAATAPTRPASPEPAVTRSARLVPTRPPRATAPPRPASVAKSSAPPAARAVVPHRVLRGSQLLQPRVARGSLTLRPIEAPVRPAQTPVRRGASKAFVPPVPVAPAPDRSRTIGTSPGGIEGSWPVCVSLLLLLLIARSLGGRLLQLVPAPHPHALLLRLERPG